jgi:outer membrane immunogenic protein
MRGHKNNGLEIKTATCFAGTLMLAGLALGSSFAAAADMSAPAPVYTKAPPPTWSWTGFYVGGNVGYGLANNNGNLSVLESGEPPLTPAQLPLLNTTDADKLKGIFGGVQAGYNWQARNFLLGIETDVQASGQQSNNTFNAIIPSAAFVSLGNNPVAVTDKSKLDWFGTTRGRLGIVSDRWLVFVTGGVAYGEINESGNALPATIFPASMNAPFVWNQTTTKVGWTVGAGVENAISANWSWKFEYLYIDLGNITSNVSGGVGTTAGFPENCYGTPGGGACVASNPAFGSIVSRFTDNVVRLGINYKFN